MKSKLPGLAIIAVTFGVATAVYLKTGWPLAKFEGGLQIPETAKLNVDGRPLDEAQSSRVRELCAKLKTRRLEVYTKPDLVLLAESPGAEPAHISIWLEEGFAFDGFYLESWTARMSGRSSPVFRLDGKTKRFFESLRQP